MLQRVAVSCLVRLCVAWLGGVLPCVAVRCCVLLCVAVCCSILQCVAVCCSVSERQDRPPSCAFRLGFHVSKLSPRHSKEFTVKP